MRRARYEAVVFDVGGTLLNVLHDPQLIAIEAIAHLGSVSAPAYSEGIRQAREEWLAAGGAADKEDLAETWIGHNRRALHLAGFTGDVSAAAELIERTFLSRGWELFADVAETLAAIRDRGLKLGVVSNWPATLETTLERAKIRHHFDVVVASGVVGYAKPHPRIFQIATEALGIAPQRSLYVGDSIEHDVRGARAAGMHPVLVDRSGTDTCDALRIRSLSQLLETLER